MPIRRAVAALLVPLAFTLAACETTTTTTPTVNAMDTLPTQSPVHSAGNNKSNNPKLQKAKNRPAPAPAQPAAAQPEPVPNGGV